MIKITIKKTEKLQEILMGTKGTIAWIDVPPNVRHHINKICKKFRIELEPSPLHITLMPIENSDDEQAAEEIRRWAASSKPMKAQLRGIEYFDNDNGTVAFVGVDCVGLEDFVESLAERLESLGMQPILFEQFVPHITIQTGMDHSARLPKEARQELEAALKGHSWIVNRISFSTPEIETNFKMGK